MILVYFRGYGEWFIRGSDGKKLAIPRTTDIPYREHNHPRQIDQPIFLSYEEWRGDLDDSDEHFAEWAHDYERQKEIRDSGASDYLLHNDDFAKPGEYDYKLDGIFSRDKNAKGDVFDTTGLNAAGVNYIKCRETQGVFKLIEEDEECFRLTNIDPKTDWLELRKIVKKLMPCEHRESAFFKEVKTGKLSNDDFGKVEFQIQSQWIRDLYGRSEPILPKDGENYLLFVSTDHVYPSTNIGSEINNNGFLNNVVEIIYGMAIDKYGYTPDLKKRDVLLKIEQKLVNIGVAIDSNDIERCLCQGLEVNKTRNGRQIVLDVNQSVSENVIFNLVIGMAIDAYEYDIYKKKNAATGRGVGSILVSILIRALAQRNPCKAMINKG